MEKPKFVKECKCWAHNSQSPYPTCTRCSPVEYLLQFVVDFGIKWDRWIQQSSDFLPFKNLLASNYLLELSVSLDCSEIFGGEERKSSLVQWILSCSWGKQKFFMRQQFPFPNSKILGLQIYNVNSSSFRPLEWFDWTTVLLSNDWNNQKSDPFFFCIYLLGSWWYICFPNAKIARKCFARERSWSPSLHNWSSINSFTRHSKWDGLVHVFVLPDVHFHFMPLYRLQAIPTIIGNPEFL